MSNKDDGCRTEMKMFRRMCSTAILDKIAIIILRECSEDESIGEKFKRH